MPTNQTDLLWPLIKCLWKSYCSLQSDRRQVDPWCHIFTLNNWSDALECLNWAPVAEVKLSQAGETFRLDIKQFVRRNPCHRKTFGEFKGFRLSERQNTRPCFNLFYLGYTLPTAIQPLQERDLPSRIVLTQRQQCWTMVTDECSSNTEIKAHMSATTCCKKCHLPAHGDVTTHHLRTWFVQTSKCVKTRGMSWDH